MRDFSGIYPMLSAFFDRNGELDRGVMRDQVKAARRMGLGEVYDRVPARQPTAFGLAVMNRRSKDLGAF